MDYGVRKEILNLSMYKAGKPISEVKRELGLERVIKLASNENPLGCSEKVKKVLKVAIEEANLYPDASNYELKQCLSEKLGVGIEQIFCGEGSDSLIKVISNTLLNPGDEVIAAKVTFPRYEAQAKLMGAEFIEVPMKDNGLDIEEMVNKITDKTKIIWFCNPNNPTGTIFTKEEFEKVLNKIPERVIFIMDEAYIEFVESNDFPNSLELLKNHPNLVILRTFSKAYGLASLRVGYGIAREELTSYFNRVIGPFDTNLFGQKAAVAAFKDSDFIEMVRENNNKGKEYLYKSFSELGLNYLKTEANFIMVNTNRDDMHIFNELIKKGVIIRPGTFLGMPGWMRVTIGTPEQNKIFIEELSKIIKK